jgi:hypothetical protein
MPRRRGPTKVTGPPPPAAMNPRAVAEATGAPVLIAPGKARAVAAPTLWMRPPRGAALHIVAVIVGGLALEAAFGAPGQHAASAWAWLLWGWLYRAGGRAERRSLVLCTLIAGSGEAVLALVWGLYDYRFGNLPLYVPPGHALLMTLGLLALRSRAVSYAVPAVCAAGAAWTVACLALDRDALGIALFALFVACMLVGRDRPLYAVMFALALAMELYGTAVGAWTWRAQVPGTGLSSANPPFAAGAFYAVLDLLVLAAVAACGRPRVARGDPAAG